VHLRRGMRLSRNDSWFSLYIASAQTVQKTLHPTVIPLLRVAQLVPSNGCFSGSTVLAFSKYATYKIRVFPIREKLCFDRVKSN
jgi:hypothetical protein